jgi:hypothetical protein
MYDITGKTLSKYDGNPFEGPYTIQKVYDNGTVVISKGPVSERVNIRKIKPYQVED